MTIIMMGGISGVVVLAIGGVVVVVGVVRG